jgi:hypothetical protein
VSALVGVAVAFFSSPPYGKRKEEYPVFVSRGTFRAYSSRQSAQPKQSQYLSLTNLAWTALGIGIIGLASWAITASFAQMSDWGFGFDLGANMAWLGLGLGCVLGIGIGASIPIWWTAMKQLLQGRR